ncbi:hypothetical protein L3V31_12250 [Vibrio sp. J1-1]|uniref:hypothetical protein n=1 Tax=Vibrio sp. J1-1 TaxID=2912251 RepID=UPI001F3BDCAC|nr:hypothetical protein [Vibrio sp. J1-1]MCF7482503.1 hypothetical protein [Vibrio sp. J1-1]
MPDVAAFGAALGSIKTAIDLAKIVKDSDLTLEKAETKLRLAELLSLLADAKMDLVDIQELIIQKDERIRELEESFRFKEEITRYKDGMYLKNDSGEPIGQPYCINCWNTKHKAHPLHRVPSKIRELKCSSCETSYLRSNVPNVEPGYLSNCE